MSTDEQPGGHFEVERKFRLTAIEVAAVQAKLERRGFVLQATSVITDTLLLANAVKDVTHRVRREQVLSGASADVHFFETVKTHPVLPNGSHVRKELESEIDAEQAQKLIADAVHETCEPSPSYSKTRRTYVGKLKGRDVTVAIDLARGLGTFSGHYIEFEVLLPIGSKPEEIEAVQDQLVAFAHKLLGDERSTQISYRKMLLKSWGRAAA